MILFKNHKSSGLTLFEVMAALTIIGLLVSSVVVLQNSSLKKLMYFSTTLHRLWLGQNKLIEIHQDQAQKKEIPTTLSSADTSTIITYKKTAFSKESTLGALPNLFREQLLLSWEGSSGKQNVPIVVIKYQPPSSPEKE